MDTLALDTEEIYLLSDTRNAKKNLRTESQLQLLELNPLLSSS